jgi:serine protease AprX
MNQAATITCPLCNDQVGRLLFQYHLDSERQVIERIRQSNPQWSEQDGICSRCLDYYHTELVMLHRMLPEIGPHFPVRSADDFIILPTGLRLNADPRFTGKGVTICFIDSEFYPHPDLITFKNRVKAIIDIPNNKNITQEKNTVSWHGTMTSVVCAGDGFLSNGLYKGIASDAELILLKVQDDAGKINDDNLAKALEWVLHHHYHYHIQIVNISLGADDSRVTTLAEKLVERGIIVVAAAGNDEAAAVKAPANAPNVITVGGLDDHNELNGENRSLYHSSYGRIGDYLLKPELIAHAIWIAAPVLPGSTKLPDDSRLISPDYMHVDGTSFAAPIVTSIIAQLLEINPALTPAIVRTILFGTAKRLQNAAAERQGFGMVQPRKAVLKVLSRQSPGQPPISPMIDRRQKTIAFYIQHDYASQISLAGSFNLWAHDALLLEPGRNGVWKIEIPMLPAGKYEYKFFVDEKVWVEDINNPYRQPDGFSGFNSIIIIEN